MKNLTNSNNSTNSNSNSAPTLKDILEETKNQLKSIQHRYGYMRIHRILGSIEILYNEKEIEDFELFSSFAGHLVRLGAAFQKDLNYFENAEKYVTNTMNAPEFDPDLLIDEPNTFDRLITLADGAGDISTVVLAASAAITLSASLPVAGIAGVSGLAAKRIYQKIRKHKQQFTKYTPKSNVLIPGRVSRDYKKKAKSYAKHQALLIKDLSRESASLLVSLKSEQGYREQRISENATIQVNRARIVQYLEGVVNRSPAHLKLLEDLDTYTKIVSRGY